MSLRMRHLAEVNPVTPEFDRLAVESDVTFVPLEAVWADSRLDLRRRRSKGEVSVGYTRFKNGDVVVPKVTPTFEAARSTVVTDLVNGVGAGSTELHVLRPRVGADARFLQYVVRSKSFLTEGVSSFQGVAGLQRVPDNFVRNFPVSPFSLEEQRRIADFLDAETTRLDALLAMTRQQIVVLTERANEMTRSATTVGFRGDTKPTGIAWMPHINAGWSLRRISRTFSVGSGTTPPSERLEYYVGGDRHWVTSADVRDGPISETRSKLTRRAIAEIPSLVVHPVGSLVIAMYGAGATKGRVGLLEIEAAVNQACCVLSNPVDVLPAFAFYWFRAHKEGIVQLAIGAGQPNLSAELIKALAVPAPPRSEQELIVQQLEADQEEFQYMTSLLRRRIALLAERRQALITAAVTGQIDVTTARGVEVA